LEVYGAQPLIGVTAGAIYSVSLGAGTTVFTGPTADADPGSPAVVDGATVWFSSQGAAVWRWTGSGRATRVADLPLRSPAVAGGWLAIAAGRPTVWMLLLAGFVEGGGSTFFGAAQAGAMRGVVPARQLPAAAGAQEARRAVVRLAGPPLGGALYGLARALPF